jgi:hypothetical protein
MGVENIGTLFPEESPESHQPCRIAEGTHAHVEDWNTEPLDLLSYAAVVVETSHDKIETLVVKVAETLKQPQFRSTDL